MIIRFISQTDKNNTVEWNRCRSSSTDLSVHIHQHNKYTGFLQRLVLYTGIGQVQLAPLHTKFSKMFRPIIQNSKNLTHGKKISCM